jgi:hypothetical protein
MFLLLNRYLWIVDGGLGMADWGLWIADYGLRIQY